MRTLQVFAVFTTLLLGIAACKKDSVVEPAPSPTTGLPVHIIGNLLSDGLGAGRFTYYRLSDSSIVPFSDSNSAKWDIAFRSTTIHINAGSSGPGLGVLMRLTGCVIEIRHQAAFKSGELGHHIDCFFIVGPRDAVG